MVLINTELMAPLANRKLVDENGKHNEKRGKIVIIFTNTNFKNWQQLQRTCKFRIKGDGTKNLKI